MADETVFLDFEKPIIEIERRIEHLKKASHHGGPGVDGEMSALNEKCRKMKDEIYGSLTPWQRVQLARHPKRPYALDYINIIFTDFTELHGDRGFADDKAMVCGFAMFEGRPVAVVAQQKGRDIKENLERNFAMAHPEGYRKALRIMKLAEKFNKPIITIIDTPGAYPGIGAEERGQAEAIARNLREMSALKVPVISVIIGEGGSGGALGIGVANRILMLENAYYSVITPEGCAAILFRDASKAPEASAALKITAQALIELGVVDEMIKEPLGGAHHNVNETALNMKNAFSENLKKLSKMSAAQLVNDRYEKFKKMGEFNEKPQKKKKTR